MATLNLHTYANKATGDPFPASERNALFAKDNDLVNSNNQHETRLLALEAANVYQLTADFPTAGAGTVTLRILEAAFTGTLTLFSSSNVTGVTYQKNGAPVTLPVAVALNDTITVSGTAGTGGGFVKLRKL
ncbi:hypothetical protein GCM10027048_27640 [Hymenobacter coalescens]